MADMLDSNDAPAIIYRRPEDEARLPGYVTIPEAARIVFRLLLPTGLFDLGSLDERHVPSRVKYDRTQPVGVRQRRVANMDGRWKTVDTFTPVENILGSRIFDGFVRLVKQRIFASILSKELKYSLIRNQVAIPNRPHVRQTIFSQRNVTFETGFAHNDVHERTHRFFEGC